MYLVLSDGWKVKISDREVFTPTGYRKLTDLRINDKIRSVKSETTKFETIVEIT